MELKILAHLLDYPTESLWQAKAQLCEIIDASTWPFSLKSELAEFVEAYFSMPLLDAQALYYETFETSRHFSLLLFEHVHGDSRERGQAMVDLITQYKQAGLELTQNQLPDYLPLMLEFLSVQSTDVAQKWLNDLAAVLTLLTVRLRQKNSLYVALFACLMSKVSQPIDEQTLSVQIADEKPDNTPEQFDAIWQEEQVLFDQNSACDAWAKQRQAQVKQAVPTYYVDINDAKRSL